VWCGGRGEEGDRDENAWGRMLMRKDQDQELEMEMEEE
jgi:hypothetical protein